MKLEIQIKPVGKLTLEQEHQILNDFAARLQGYWTEPMVFLKDVKMNIGIKRNPFQKAWLRLTRSGKKT